MMNLRFSKKAHKQLTNNKRRNTARQQSGASRSETVRNGPRPTYIPVTGNEVVERGIPGYSALRYRAKLTYFEPTIQMSTGAGTAGTYIFSANGLYDPDYTSTGHQPMAFDQLMLSFEHYVVTKARITVNARNIDTTYPLGFAVSLSAANSAVTSYTALVENGNMVRTRLQPANFADSMATLTIPIDIARFGGVSNLLDVTDYSGTVIANPAEQSYFHISLWNPSNTTVASAQMEVYIEYESWFIEPRKNSVSLSSQISRLIVNEARSEKKC